MKRRCSLLLLVAAALSVAACKKESRQAVPEAQVPASQAEESAAEQIAPPEELPTIWFHPMDGATGVGEVVAEIRLEGGESIDAKLVQALESSARLETDSGVLVRMNRTSSRPAGEGPRAEIALLPADPLAAGSYVLRLPLLPDGIAEPHFPSHVRLEDGSIGVRFRVDSAPNLWGVRICKKESGTQLVVEFSERLQATKDIAAAVKIASGGRDLGCKGAPHGTSGEVGSLSFSCPELSADAQVEVTIGEGLSGAAGARLAASTHRFVPAELAPWGSGCSLYRSQP